MGRPISFTLFTGDKVTGGWREFTDGLEKAAADKLPIKGQFYPRPIGMLFGFDLSYHPFSLNPSYKAIAHLPIDQKVAVMRDPEMRRKILSEDPEDPNPFFLLDRPANSFALPAGRSA